jgi:phage gp29-like protein
MRRRWNETAARENISRFSFGRFFYFTQMWFTGRRDEHQHARKKKRRPAGREREGSMNPTGQSQFDQARIEWAIRLRYSPLPELSTKWVSDNLNAFRIGELRVIGKIWEIMMERDGDLAVNADKRAGDLAGLEWKVVSDGSAEGDGHAAALNYFYRNLRVTRALDQDVAGGVSELLYQMASAHSYYYSAHEILLRIDNGAAREVTAELRQTPVWFFESRRGYLGYLQHIFDVYGQPCLQGEWLTCVGSGWMRPLCMAFVLKNFPLRDWLLFCSRYGSGFLEGVTDAQKNDPAWEEAREALETMANDGVVLHNTGVSLKFLDMPAKNALPFEPLVEHVNRLYAKCYRGIDLATGTRTAEAGQRHAPVGASVQKEEAGIFLLRDAIWATGYLNDRVDAPIIRYLFNQEPRAAVAIMPPEDDTSAEDMQTVQALVPLGLRIALKDAYKRFRWEAPAEGEPCLAPPVQSAPGDPNDPAGGAALPRSPVIPPANPATADEAEATTQTARPEKPIGAGADPASIGKPQSFAPEMPDPQVDAAGFWSSAGAALRSIFGPFVNKGRDASPRRPHRMTDGTLPASATAIPNSGGAAACHVERGEPPPSDKFLSTAEQHAAAAFREDMTHAHAEIAALLQIDDPDHFKTKSTQVQRKWDQITANTLLAPSLADALKTIVGTAYASGWQRTEDALDNAWDPNQPRGSDGRFLGFIKIPDEKWTGTVDEMRERADKIMRSHKPANHPTLGPINFTKAGRNKTLRDKTTPHQFQAVQALPELSEKGRHTRWDTDRKGRPHIAAVHTVEHGLKIGKDSYLVRKLSWPVAGSGKFRPMSPARKESAWQDWINGRPKAGVARPACAFASGSKRFLAGSRRWADSGAADTWG